MLFHGAVSRSVTSGTMPCVASSVRIHTFALPGVIRALLAVCMDVPSPGMKKFLLTVGLKETGDQSRLDGICPLSEIDVSSPVRKACTVR